MAYLFWRAGQDDRVREAQNRLAADRIGVFYNNSNFRVKDRKLSDYVTSEVGVALVFDQHVNRPGHVKRCWRKRLIWQRRRVSRQKNLPAGAPMKRND